MTPSANPSLELLLTEAAWLRRLAQHLVRDPASAEDVVQETWMTALRSGGDLALGGDSRMRRGWLARVAKNVAGSQFRGSSRRGQREQRAGELRPAREVPTPEDLGVRMELQQRVAEALLGLREPFRATLYMLYYEGRSAMEIAEQLGESPATIRTRAHRGRELLRDSLVQEGKDWSEWASALAPLAGLGPKGALATPAKVGAASMVSSWILGAGALTAVLALVAGAWWVLRPVADSNPATPLVISASASAPGPSAADRALEAVGAELRVPQDPAAAAPMEVLLTGDVTQADGQPAGHVRLTFGRGKERRQVFSDSSDGSWALPGIQSGSWRVATYKSGFREQVLEVEVPPERMHSLRIQLEPLIQVPVRFVKPDGTSLVGFTRPDTQTYRHVARPIPIEERQGGGLGRRARRRGGAGGPEPLVFYPQMIVTAKRPGARLTDVDTGGWGSVGLARWAERESSMLGAGSSIPDGCQGVLHVDGELPAWFSLTYGDLVLESRLVSQGPDELRFPVSQAALRATQGTIQFEVRDPLTAENLSKQYLEGRSGIGLDGRRPSWVGLENGRVTIYDVAPGEHWVQFGAPNSKHERVSIACRVEPGAATQLEPVPLRPGKEFRVRVVDASGTPVKAKVHAMRKALARGVPPEHWSGFDVTDPAGVARFPTVAEGAIWVLVQQSRPDVWMATSIDTRESTLLEVTLPKTTPVRFLRSLTERMGRYDLLRSDGVPLNSLGVLHDEIHLPPGQYLIRKRAGTAGGRTTSFTVAEAAITIDLSEVN